LLGSFFLLVAVAVFLFSGGEYFVHDGIMGHFKGLPSNLGSTEGDGFPGDESKSKSEGSQFHGSRLMGVGKRTEMPVKNDQTKTSEESKHYDRGKNHGHSAKENPSGSFPHIRSSGMIYDELRRSVLESLLSEMCQQLNGYLWQLNINITESVVSLTDMTSPGALGIRRRDVAGEIGGKANFWEALRFPLMPILKRIFSADFEFGVRLRKNINSEFPPKTSKDFEAIRDGSKSERGLVRSLENIAIQMIIDFFEKEVDYRCCCDVGSQKGYCGPAQKGLYGLSEPALELGKELIFCHVVSMSDIEEGGLGKSEGGNPAVDGELFVEFGIHPDVQEFLKDHAQCSMQLILDDSY
jgi:hypothetical protein